jgi:DNA-directed RNA polymerase subunit RPC12/RpoP
MTKQLIDCPVCGHLAVWSPWFKRYFCLRCGWESEEGKTK